VLIVAVQGSVDLFTCRRNVKPKKCKGGKDGPECRKIGVEEERLG